MAKGNTIDIADEYELFGGPVSPLSETHEITRPQSKSLSPLGGLSPNLATMGEVFGESSNEMQGRWISPSLSERIASYSYPDPEASAPALPYPALSSSRRSSTVSEKIAKLLGDPDAPLPDIDDSMFFPFEPSLVEDFSLKAFTNSPQTKRSGNTEVLLTSFGIGLPSGKLPGAIPGEHSPKPLPPLDVWNTYDPEDLAILPTDSITPHIKPRPMPHSYPVMHHVRGTALPGLANATKASGSVPVLMPSTTRKAVHDPEKREVRVAELLKREGFGTDPSKKWVKLNPTKGLNLRASKIATYDPEEHYDPLPKAPDSWACFKYEYDGELQERAFYTVRQMQKYLFEHYLHRATESHDPKDGGLILWIQKVPADSARRYPRESSPRCRFKSCCATNNTINQGQYRVAFDEQSYKDANYDPMINAGYVHLYCLEKFLDFPLICQMLDVRAEDRRLPNEPSGKNRMLMSSDQERDGARKFINYCKRKGIPAGYPNHNMPNRPHEGTLTHMLALQKKVNERGAVLKQQHKRGLKSSIISEHLGDLELEMATRTSVRKAAADRTWDDVRARSRPSRLKKGTKRGRDDDEDYEESPATKKRGQPSKEVSTKSSTLQGAESDSASDVIFLGKMPKRTHKRKLL